MRSHPSLASFLRGAAVGAAAMYVLDPDKGRRRRAIVRDKSLRLLADAGDVFAAAGRDLGNRVRGARASAAQHVLQAVPRDDLQLIERVRARIGRVVSNPHAIQVGAHDGRVMLSGPVLAAEAGALVDATRAVPGVVSVDDHLDVHATPGSVPSLQGAHPRVRSRAQALGHQATPLQRAATILGGAVIALYGLSRRSLTGVALAGIGTSLAAQAARRAAEDEHDAIEISPPARASASLHTGHEGPTP